MQAIKQRYIDAKTQESTSCATLQTLKYKPSWNQQDANLMNQATQQVFAAVNEQTTLQQEYAQLKQRLDQYLLNKGIACANHVLNSHHSHGVTGATGLTG